jgi:adenylate kinase
MLNLIIFGPPGSGKGTQAALIAKKYKLAHLSSGDILRQELKNGSLGASIKKYQETGRLVPDNIIIAMMEATAVRKLKTKGLVFDGYPRNLRQARQLDRFLKEQRTALTLVLNLKLSEQDAQKRIINRGKTSGRNDDNLKTIRTRFQIYRAQTEPILKYYQAQKKIIAVDGRPSIQKVTQNITDILKKQQSTDIKKGAKK